MPELVEDLDNCMISFDHKVVVTNLLDEYGGQLEEIAKTVNDFLTAEEAKGKKYLKTFLLRGLQPDSENEVITLVPADKLKQREQQLRNTHSLLYSAETDGGAKSPPIEFVPLKHISITLDSLEVKPEKQASAVTNGHVQANVVKDEKPPAKKTGALGAMFKKQETTAAATAKKSPEQSSTKKEEKPAGSLGAMFKKQESVATAKKEIAKKSPETEKKPKPTPEKTKKSESLETEKKPKPTPEKTKKSEAASKKSFGSKKDESKSVLKPPTPKKMNEFFKKDDAKKLKLDPNVSVNLFEESSSSEDEEALDALKRELLTDEEEEKATTSNKRRRIIDSDDEDTGPEVKIERREEEPEAIEVEDDQANESATFMDEDGFIVTVKAKNKKPAAKSSPAPAPVTVKIKKESPPTPLKKETTSKTPAAKKKQGNIMSFFKKK